MTINKKSERNYRGKCLGWPVNSYGGDSLFIIFTVVISLSGMRWAVHYSPQASPPRCIESKAFSKSIKCMFMFPGIS